MNQEEVRNRLVNHMVKTEMGITKIAIAIGIAHTTAIDFVTKSKDVRFVTLSRIHNYLDKVVNS